MASRALVVLLLAALVAGSFSAPVAQGASTWKVLTDATTTYWPAGTNAPKHTAAKDPQNPKYQEATGGGACFGDFNGDGFPDLYVTDSGDKSLSPKNHLYRNDPNPLGGREFTDVTDSVTGLSGWYQGCAWGDYDNDGKLDLYVAGYGGSVLLHNDGGGSFTNVTASAGVSDTNLDDCASGQHDDTYPVLACWASGVTWLDYDRDGFLDLYVTNYVDLGERNCANTNLAPATCGGEANVLYHNNGDGTFTNVAAAAGVDYNHNPGPNSALTGGRSLQAVAADVNGDGWPDLWVANDEDKAALYLNNGDGTFTDATDTYGLSPQGSCTGLSGCAGMGLSVADYDNNGALDLWGDHFQGEPDWLFAQSSPGGSWSDASSSVGLNTGENTSNRIRWGGGWLSFRNDVTPDFFDVAGDPTNDAPENAYLYFWNATRSAYVNEYTAPENTGWDLTALSKSLNARGVAYADLDKSGAESIFVATQQPGSGTDTAHLFTNGVKGAGSPFTSNHFLEVTLVGKTSNKAAIGATVKLTAGGVTQSRVVTAGDSYQSAHELRQHFGMGTANTGTLEIDWPSTDVGGGQCTDTYPLKSGDVDNADFKFTETCNGPPPAPRDVTVSNVGATSAKLSWRKFLYLDDFAAYDVYRSDAPDFTPDATNRVARLTSRSTGDWTASGLSPSTQYYFKIALEDTAGQFSAPTAALSVLTTKLPPPAVTLSAGAAGATTLAVTWTKSTAPNFASDELRLDDKRVANFTSVDNVSYTATGLLDNTTHTFVVRTWNQDLLSADSNVVTMTTVNVAPPAVTLATPAPTDIGATSVKLAWTKSAAHDFAHYALYEGAGAAAPSSAMRLVATIPAASTNTTTLTGLTDNTAYTFRVDVVDTGALAGASNVVSVTTKALPPPGVAVRVNAANATTDSVEIDWTPTSVHDFARYELYAAPNASVPRDAAHLVRSFTDIATDHATIVGLADATDVFALVRLVTTADLASDSDVVKATTLNAPPPAVTLDTPAIDAVSGSLALAWSPSDAHDFARYEVLLGTTAAAPRIATVGERNATTYVAHGLAPGAYSFRVAVVDTGGLSTLSNVASVTLPPRPKYALAATAAPDAADGLLVSWTHAAAGDIAGFTVADDAGHTVALPASADEFEARGLAVGASRCFIVTLTALDGSTESASPACATVPDPDGAVLVVWDLRAVPSDHSVNLTWLSPVGASARAVIRLDGIPVATIDGTRLAERGREYARARGLRDGTVYSFRIELAHGASRAASAERTFTTLPDMAAPHPPTALAAASASPGTVTITWLAPPDDDLAGYHVLRVTPDGRSVDVARVAAGAPLAWTDLAAPSGPVVYRVVAVDLAGRASDAAEVAFGGTAPTIAEPLAKSATNASTVKLSDSQATHKTPAPDFAVIAVAVLGVALAARPARKTRR
ncbi:MAG: fibronectin type III domain-containing protein [Thermoplasmatota archaeon]